MKKTKIPLIITISIILLLSGLFSGCTGDNLDLSAKNPEIAKEEMTTYKVGVILPLSGDVAFMGETVKRVQDKALSDLNSKWKAEGKAQKIELIYEDGQCQPKKALNSVQNLANVKGVKVILGGGCSDETLGAAPFANANKIVMLSSTSTSPEITNSGDYIFRTIPSDDNQAVIAAEHMKKSGHKRIAIISENTDYSQALRKKLISEIEKNNLEVVADEVVSSDQKDLKTNMLKIKTSNPDVIFVNPHSFPSAERFNDHIKQIIDLKNVQYYATEVYLEILEENSIEGLIAFRHEFDGGTPDFKRMANETGCEFGYFCAVAYDSVLLMAEALDECGEDTECIKNKFYATKNWQGKYQGSVTFDENGDVEGHFDTYQILNGKPVKIN